MYGSKPTKPEGDSQRTIIMVVYILWGLELQHTYVRSYLHKNNNVDKVKRCRDSRTAKHRETVASFPGNKVGMIAQNSSVYNPLATYLFTHNNLVSLLLLFCYPYISLHFHSCLCLFFSSRRMDAWAEPIPEQQKSIFTYSRLPKPAEVHLHTQQAV